MSFYISFKIDVNNYAGRTLVKRRKGQQIPASIKLQILFLQHKNAFVVIK